MKEEEKKGVQIP
jgi:glycylpeptide N-tetradecanoyltransferase